MTLGSALLWIAFIALCVWGFRVITKKKKWKLIFKILGGVILLGVLIGLSVWAWYWNENRPTVANALGDVSLGMTPVEVKLALGQPTHETRSDNVEKTLWYTYSDYFGNIEYLIRFSDDPNLPEQVEIVCSGNYQNEVFGLGKYNSEEEVLKKLGTPSNQSIRQDGLAKMISYEKWKVSFEVQKGEVTKACVTESGKVSFLNEYSSEEIN